MFITTWTTRYARHIQQTRLLSVLNSAWSSKESVCLSAFLDIDEFLRAGKCKFSSYICVFNVSLNGATRYRRKHKLRLHDLVYNCLTKNQIYLFRVKCNTSVLRQIGSFVYTLDFVRTIATILSDQRFWYFVFNPRVCQIKKSSKRLVGDHLGGLVRTSTRFLTR